MEKERNTKKMMMIPPSCEFELPIEIIQHIQSFLDDGEEAIRTCLLSKSWYGAWSTRPVLVFRSFRFVDDRQYNVNVEHAEFWDYTLRTIDRYKESNLRLQKLVMAIGNTLHCTSLIDRLIAGASTLGVTELDYRDEYYMDFPVQVFDITSLTKLSIRTSKIYQLGSRVLCSGLVSLKLHYVRIHYHVIRRILLGCPLIQNLVLHNVDIDDDVDKSVSNDRILCPSLVSLSFGGCRRGNRLIQDILSRCPSIEKLELSQDDILLPHHVWTCTSFKSLSFSDCTIHIDNDTTICSRLVSLSFQNTRTDDYVIRDILSRCPLIENLHLERPRGLVSINVSAMHNLVSLFIHRHHWDSSTNVSFESNTSGSSVLEFKKLCLLSLKDVNVNNEFFNKFSTRFPCVEDVALCFCRGHEEIRISSLSVKYLNLHHSGKLQKAEFNVPNIRMFVYNGENVIPSLSFHTGSSDWESEVSLSFPLSSRKEPVIDSFWFVKLREFLSELSQSRISFHIKVDERMLIWVNNIPSSHTPVVENLIIDNYCSFQTKAYLCALLGCCRPTLITLKCPKYLLTYSFAQILHEIFMYQNAQFSNRVQS